MYVADPEANRLSFHGLNGLINSRTSLQITVTFFISLIIEINLKYEVISKRVNLVFNIGPH